ncbi:hypothetical protein HGRIS_002158 [Hohenbuehelia grisea]|uniref:AMP binding protein n=1 Tax=Hohenbuehelia grisea TaxID=104357 RepID=A0ABR3JJM6_9AGAR
MSPKVYKSLSPSVPLRSHSIFTHLFASTHGSDVGGYAPSSPAFVDAPTGTTLTRGQLKHLALTFGYGLLNTPGLELQRGDTVLIYSPNSLAWPVVLFGSIAAGLRCTLANSAYTSAELRHQYLDSGAKTIITAEDGLPTVQAFLTGLSLSNADIKRRTIVIPNDLSWATSQARPSKTPSDPLRLNDILSLGTLPSEAKFDGDDCHETVLLCYSSGTTGKPKGVETTHRNLTTVLEIVKPVFPTLTQGKDNILGVLPFYHIYGAIKLVHFPFSLGVPCVIQSKFDPVTFCRDIEKYNVTLSLIVPPILVVLSRHEAVDKYDLSSLRVVFSGAAPLGAALAKDVKDRILARRGGKGEFSVTQGYGLTETSPTCHCLPAHDSERKMGSIGLLLPNLEARLVVDGEGDGNIDADEGQPGELWLRGPTIMKGYLNNPTATADCITEDKWFKTGDIAVRDGEGYYYIVDRRKELIKYKGFQVPPAELESVLLTQPEVADAAVIGVYDEQEATELPRAYIVPAHLSKLNTEQSRDDFARSVAAWIQIQVAHHKFLRGGVVVTDIIPKSAAGKILRRQLRDRAKDNEDRVVYTLKAKL